jgi:hypothetical protein
VEVESDLPTNPPFSNHMIEESGVQIVKDRLRVHLVSQVYTVKSPKSYGRALVVAEVSYGVESPREPQALSGGG